MSRHETRGPCPRCGFNPDSYKPLNHHLPPNSRLGPAGKYIVCRALGEGGFGITYIGFNYDLQLKVAIKEYYPRGFVTRDAKATRMVMPFTGASENFFEKGRSKFIDEARALARFDNDPGIVTIKDYFEENGTAYIIMEYISGINLGAYADKYGGKIETRRVLSMLRQPMLSLERVHRQQLIHRDISPENIMISDDGAVKLIDFGAAKTTLNDSKASTTLLLRPGYAPIEQYRSRGEQGPWTDVYALCATIYRAITGITPPEAPDRITSDELEEPSKLGVKIDKKTERALMRGLSVLSKNRQQSMNELMAELEPPPMPDPKPKSSYKKIIVAAAIVALLGAAALGYFMFFSASYIDFDSDLFDRYVVAALKDKDKRIDEDEAAGVTKLEIRENVMSVNGAVIAETKREFFFRSISAADIAKFPNLAEVIVDGVEVTNIAELANLKQLTRLTLTDCGIREIDLLDLTARLDYLNLSYNGIADVSTLDDMKPGAELIMICNHAFADSAFREQIIATLSANEELSDIAKLYITPDGMFRQDPGAYEGALGEMKTADIKMLTGLTELYIYSVKLDDLSPISALTRLEKLALVNCDIDDIGFVSGLSNLKYLDIALNSVADFSPAKSISEVYGWDADARLVNAVRRALGLGDGEKINYSDLTRITRLEIGSEDGAEFDLAPLAQFTNITSVQLNGLKLINLRELSALENLSALEIRDCDFSADELARLTRVTRLEIIDCALENLDFASGMGALAYLDVSGSGINDFSPADGVNEVYGWTADSKLMTAVRQALGLSDGAPINYRDFTRITQLSIMRGDGPNFDLALLQSFPNIAAVQLNGLNLLNISELSALENLSALHMSHCNISADDFAALTRVTRLEIFNCGLENLNFVSGMDALTYLDVTGNDIHDFSLAANIAEVYGWDSDEKLVSAVRQALGLGEDAPINYGDFASITELSIMSEDGAEFDIARLAPFPNIAVLTLSGLDLQNLAELSALEALSTLAIRDCNLSDVEFVGGLGALASLDVSGNPNIADLSPLARANLTYLDVTGCELGAENWDYVGHIEVVGLNKIEIADIELWKALSNKTIGYLSFTPDGVFVEAGGEPILGARARIELKILDYIEGLETLRLENVSVTGAEHIANCAGLRRVTLINVEGCADIDFLSAVENIEYIELSGFDIGAMPPLAGVAALREFYADSCGITDISTLAGVRADAKISLDGNPIGDWSAIADVENVAGRRIWDADFKQMLLSAKQPSNGHEYTAGDLYEIETLWISSDKLLIDERPGGYAPGMARARTPLSIANIEYLPNLRELYIQNAAITGAEAIGSNKLLAIVWLNNCGLENCDFAAGLTGHLTELMMCENEELLSVEPLKDCGKLFVLNISNCEKIESLAPLEQMQNLHELYINNCANIDSLRPLEGLRNLSVLEAHGMPANCDWSYVERSGLELRRD